MFKQKLEEIRSAKIEEKQIKIGVFKAIKERVSRPYVCKNQIINIIG